MTNIKIYTRNFYNFYFRQDTFYDIYEWKQYTHSHTCTEIGNPLAVCEILQICLDVKCGLENRADVVHKHVKCYQLGDERLVAITTHDAQVYDECCITGPPMLLVKTTISSIAKAFSVSVRVYVCMSVTFFTTDHTLAKIKMRKMPFVDFDIPI